MSDKPAPRDAAPSDWRNDPQELTRMLLDMQAQRDELRKRDAAPCPVSAEELRELAEEYDKRAKLHSRHDLQDGLHTKATKLRTLAVWLENMEKR